VGFKEDKSPDSNPRIRARCDALCALERRAGGSSDWGPLCQLFEPIASPSTALLSTVSEVLVCPMVGVSPPGARHRM